MTNPHGSWIWYELITADIAKAKAFYDPLIGWDIDSQSAMPGGEVDYRMIKVSETDFAGGALQLTDGMQAEGARAGWFGYIGVDDVDASVAAITAEGGVVQMPPHDIPNVGRIAMVADPQGIPIYVMRGASDEDSNAYGRTILGHVSWNELTTTDNEAALAFYAKTFGWKKQGGMPMGPDAEYAFVSTSASDEPFGATMPKMDPNAPTQWNFYFRVPDIEAAHARVKELGGTPHSDPMEVPGGERVFFASDPEGVAFGLVAPR